MKTVELKEWPNQYFIDLTPAIPFLDALDAFENFPSIFAFSQYCDTHDIPDDNEMEEALDLIHKHAPWLLPVIDRWVANEITRQANMSS